MLFKGRYSPLLSRKCGQFRIDPSEVDRKFHLSQGNIYTRTYGWIKPNQIIFEIKNPALLRGKKISLGDSPCSHWVKRDRSPIFDVLRTQMRRLNNGTRILKRSIERIMICPYNPNLILVEFRSDDGSSTDIIQRFANEDGASTGGGNPKNGNESAEVSPNGSYGPGLDVSKYSKDDIKQLPGSRKTRKGSEKLKSKTVGIVDRGHFSQSKDYFHVDVINQIIGAENLVNTLNMPMVDSPLDEATTFDMICALSNKKWLSQVDVINISQGHYATVPHPLLYKVIRCLDQVVVCSAGNKKFDNDQQGHWPSNFSLVVDHVAAIGNIDQQGNFHFNSNFGNESVTLSAIGDFGDKIFGTSYAAAWTSRMIALSYALTERNDLTLAEVIDEVRKIYPVQFNTADATLTKTRLLLK